MAANDAREMVANDGEIAMTVGLIEVDNVSKRFRLRRNRPTSIKEAVLRFGRKDEADDFWALRDVNLNVAAGSFLGLIGHNGSGKSTLLRLMAGIHKPTTGSIATSGRLTALLELGAGFHPDLTGRENVYLNGAMLGLTRKQMASRMPEIVDFSGIGDFIDEPIKIYSSGMYVRLAFAIATNVDPDILLVDEVMAVGDEEFQRRCLAHLEMLLDGGTTIVLVSHSSDLMMQCHQVGWMEKGCLLQVGEPEEVVSAYLHKVEISHNPLEDRLN